MSKSTINLEDENVKSSFTGKFQEQISDDPDSGLIRVIDYHGANINHSFRIIAHDATMKYFNKEGIHLPKYGHKVTQRGRDWLVDNTYVVSKRDGKGKEILGDDKQPIKAPAYDYFIEIVFNTPAPLNMILKSSIQLDDSLGLFNE